MANKQFLTTHLDKERTFNMDALFLDRMNSRLDELDQTSTTNQQYYRYRQLYNLFINAHFKFNDEEIADLEKKFKKCRQTMQAQPPSRTQSASLQHQAVLNNALELELDEIHFMIIKLLYNYDIIYLKSRKKLTAIEEFDLAFT